MSAKVLRQEHERRKSQQACRAKEGRECQGQPHSSTQPASLPSVRGMGSERGGSWGPEVSAGGIRGPFVLCIKLYRVVC